MAIVRGPPRARRQGVHLLGPVGSKDFGYTEVIDRGFVTLQDGDDAERITVPVEEAFAPLEERRNCVCVLSGEDEQFEARIRRR